MRPVWKKVNGKWLLLGVNFLVFGSRAHGWLVLWKSPELRYKSAQSLMNSWDEVSFMGYFEKRGEAEQMFAELEERSPDPREVTLVGVHRPSGAAVERMKRRFGLGSEDIEALMSQGTLSSHRRRGARESGYLVRYPQDDPLLTVTHEIGHLKAPAREGMSVIESEERAIRWQIDELRRMKKYTPRRRGEIVRALWGHLEHVDRARRGEEGPYADEAPGGKTLDAAERTVVRLEKQTSGEGRPQSPVRLLKELEERRRERRPVITGLDVAPVGRSRDGSTV